MRTVDSPITELLPHKGRMLLIDRVVVKDGDWLLCQGRVRDDNPFVRNDGLSRAAFVEYMAQATAANVAIFGRPGFSKGYLVAGRNIEIMGDADVGDMLDIRVKELSSMGQFASYEGEVFVSGQLICYGTVNVFQVGDDV